MENMLGIYEKALPQNMNWNDRLITTKKLGFDFIEISIDETDERLNRLYWSKGRREELVRHMYDAGVPILSMCFSGHRRFPLGSRSEETRNKAFELMERAIEFASDVGIRVIQLAGYDVYYEASGEETRNMFIDGLRRSVKMAEKKQVMLAIEIMDTPFINSITKYLRYDDLIASPWLTVYPDLGNLSAWGNDVQDELEKGFKRIVAVHVKDALAVTPDFGGKFREVPFGTGCVDFVKAFRKLRNLGYKGPFLIEMWAGKSKDPIDEIVKAKQWVESRLKESGF